ncbi:hypothetical protein Tco_0632645 [Tanacetum coccineum]
MATYSGSGYRLHHRLYATHHHHSPPSTTTPITTQRQLFNDNTSLMTSKQRRRLLISDGLNARDLFIDLIQMIGEWKEVKRRNKGSMFDRLGREQRKHKESRFEELHNVYVTVYCCLGPLPTWPNTKSDFGMRYAEHVNGPRSYATTVKGNNDNSKAQSDKVLMKKIVLNQSDLLVVPDTSSCVVLAKIEFNSKDVDERIVWVELDGIPHSAWTSNAFKKVIHESIYDVFSVSINNENYRVRVKEFTCWVPDYDTIDDTSQKDWASNNADSDEDNQSIHINDEEEKGELKDNNINEENINMQAGDEVKDTVRDHTNDSKSVIKPTWDEEVNNLEVKNAVFKKDDKVNNDQEVSNSPSKPPRFEGIQFATSTFNHGKQWSGVYLANSHSNAKGSRNGNSQIHKRKSTGGYAFTRISSNGEKLSCLDRFLVSEDVINIVPNLMALAIDMLISDHRPIILMQSNVDFSLTPFKLYNLLETQKVSVTSKL